MKIFDISWIISNDMTTYKDKKTVDIQQTKKFKDNHVRETMLCINSHTGTHIDAPSHFMEQGKSIDQLDPLCCSGSAEVIDMSHITDCITKKDVEHITNATNKIILFKTKNSLLHDTAPFDYHFVYVDKTAALHLVQLNIKAIGIDYLGIERNQPDHETHITFMQKNIPIIEGLRLKDVSAGLYTLWCLPLSMKGLDGAPARALLIQE